MRKSIIFTISLFLLLATSAYANLHNNGIDSLGNQLIYDDYFNVTWYDYSNTADTWQNQVDWADALSVTVEDNVYNNWRLPTTAGGEYVGGVDGTTTGGLNITSSEMGHLFYTDLENNGTYDTSGVYQPDYGLKNTGDFQNLKDSWYWTGTEYSPNLGLAWHFVFSNGVQGFNIESRNNYAIAVHPGNIASTANTVVPEPISSTLFLVGASVLGFRRFRKA